MSVVGIDLGTTNTVVACVRGGRVHVLADDQGRRLLPSVVSFHPNGEVLVGQPAKERRVVDAKNTVASVKRLIGRSWRSEEIAKARPRFAFEMKEGPGHAPLVVARGQEYTLPEISAYVLRKAKAIAERALGEPVERAVITVPANFNELQRASTKVAGRVAGLEVLRILNEPTAAALAYGLGKGGHERIAIYDFGGGTFDCTLLDLSGNVFEVLATSGDSFLGGDDIDMAIADRMAEAFLLQHRYDPKQDVQAYERLRAYAEVIKMELSAQPQARAHLREVAYGVGGAHLDLSFGLTRVELETIAEPFIERTFRVCQDAMALAGLSVSSLDKVILVGGSTRIPAVRRRVEQFFGAPPLDRVSADEVVAIGAAIQAAALTDAARRRSIPPAPVPGASRTTLRGMNQPDPGQLRRSDPNLDAAAAQARKILAQTGGRPSAPPLGGLGATVRLDGPPVRSESAPPAPLDAGSTQPMPTVPDHHPGSDNEITRPHIASPLPPPMPARPPAPSAPSLGGANIGDLADTYATTAPTRPGTSAGPPLSPVRDPASILASTLPLVSPLAPRIHDPDATTVPGDALSAALGIDADPTARSEAPAPSPQPRPAAGSPMVRTQPMQQQTPPGPPVMQTLPLVTPASPRAPIRAPSAPSAPLPPPAPPITPPPAPPPPSPPAPPVAQLVPQQTVVLAPQPAPPPATAPPPPPPPPQPSPRPLSGPPAGPSTNQNQRTLTVSLPPGPLTPPLLIDVTPRALVVETVGGFCDTIVSRNSKIPCERTRAFATVSDGQTVVRIRVAQGEGEHFGENVYLGEVELAGLRAAARGEVTVSVTFGVDANGTLQVSATDIATGRAARATLQLLGVAAEESIATMRARTAMQRMSSPPG